MVKHEWGVRWLETGHVIAEESEEEARDVVANWPGKCELVSHWVRESPWRAV